MISMVSLVNENKKKGKFVLSLDCELSWGSHYYGGQSRFGYLKNGFNQYYDDLLLLLDQYNIAATFAFVALSIVDRAEFDDLIKSMNDEGYKKWLMELFEKSAADEPSFWHNVGLVRNVMSRKQQHEIASHSLSHLPFTHACCSTYAARQEINLSHKILEQCSGLGQTVTYIFPENHLDHLDIVRQSPFLLYRGATISWYDGLPFKRLLHFLDQFVPIAPPSVSLSKDKFNNFFLPGSLLLLPYDGIRKMIPDDLRFLKIKRGIDKAVKEGGIFHLWFHPWNLGSSTRMKQVLERVLEYVCWQRECGNLEVVRMCQLVPNTHQVEVAEDIIVDGMSQ